MGAVFVFLGLDLVNAAIMIRIPFSLHVAVEMAKWG